MSQYKLSIAAFVLVPMEFSLQNGEETSNFSFKIQARRISPNEWQAGMAKANAKIKEIPEETADKMSTDEIAKPIRDFVFSLMSGWRDQTLVLDDDGAPAAFCREAVDVMLSIPGLLDMFINRYAAALKAKEKN